MDSRKNASFQCGACSDYNSTFFFKVHISPRRQDRYKKLSKKQARAFSFVPYTSDPGMNLRVEMGKLFNLYLGLNAVNQGSLSDEIWDTIPPM